MRKNAKSVFCLVSLLVLVMLLALPGCKEEPAKSSKKDIISFEIGDARGVFDQIENNTTISLIVPADSDLSKLTPVITVSDGATVSPASGVENNFTNPVTYTVTAENGDIRHFTVNVEAAEKASENEILSFKIGDAGGVFYYDTISLIVPADSDLSKLTPVITVSDGATVSPASGVENNFTNPVTYTVTAGNGDIRHFTVNVEAAAKSSGKDIIDFKIGDAIGAIEEYNKTVSLTVPIDSDLSALTPVITVSNGAAVSPASDVEMDFTNPVTFTVKSFDIIIAIFH